MQSHGTRAQTTVFPVSALLTAAVLILALLTACGGGIREKRAEHERLTAAVQSLDPQEVLAGRKAEDVLVSSVASFRCSWLDKGILFPSECRSIVTDAAYNPDLRQLVVRQFHEYPWGPGTTHRTTSDVVIPLVGMQVWIIPPNPAGSLNCWQILFSCPDNKCIQVNKIHQHMTSGSVTDKGTDSYRTKYWSLLSQQREKGVDAWAALRILSKETGETTTP